MSDIVTTLTSVGKIADYDISWKGFQLDFPSWIVDNLTLGSEIFRHQSGKPVRKQPSSNVGPMSQKEVPAKLDQSRRLCVDSRYIFPIERIL